MKTKGLQDNGAVVHKNLSMMELSPAYCDVIVTRWEQATGKKAVLSAR